jgi:predicted metal-dependent hydrolase
MIPPYVLRRIKHSKRMTLSVKAGARVVVTAPFRIPKRDIDAFVFAQKQWIERVVVSQKKKEKQWKPNDEVSQENYYACKARSLKFVRERLTHFALLYNVSYSRVSVKQMSSRWGSCSEQGNMSFHWRLLFLPTELADYVVVHEICHLIELNHSDRFWRLVQQTIPDWRKRRKALEGYVI